MLEAESEKRVKRNSFDASFLPKARACPFTSGIKLWSVLIYTVVQ